MLEIVPGEADQVTATFEVLLTRAVNSLVPTDCTVAVAGETVTSTSVGLDDDELEGTETPEQAVSKRKEATKVTRIAHWDKWARYERRRFLTGGSAWCDIQLPLEWGFKGRSIFEGR